jgi:hypothetical protein
LGNRPLTKDAPLFGWNGNHHAAIGGGDFVGQVVSGKLLLDFLNTMHTPQGGLYHGEDVVSHER